MPPRFYCPDLAGTQAVIEGDQLHHLRTVRRLGQGDEVELFDGCGRLARCRLVRLDRHGAEAEILQTHDAPPPAARLTVATAVPKAGRMDTLVEKVTELGVTAIWPLDCEHSSVADSGEGKQQSWRRRAVEACKQCGRLYLPQIAPPMSLQDALAGMGREAVVLLADPSPDAGQPAAVLADVPAGADLVAFIGPEGGFTDAERQHTIRCGGRAIRLAHAVLRIETAAIAMAAVVAAWRRNE
ncbi:MAG: 16S rRNA (uracil(1498)-N(3))-methyltransferase [Planctomycetes bacterium]|nr:16S rRNA (uracil(1498)-N(3))-methyltransferase [Planctomycetota bacterium]